MVIYLDEALEERDLDLFISLSLMNTHCRYSYTSSNEWIKREGEKCNRLVAGRGGNQKKKDQIHLSIDLIFFSEILTHS